MVEIPLQFRFDVARILALRAGDEPFDHHGANLRLAMDDGFELVAHVQVQKIGESDAIDRRDERRRNAMTALGGIVLVLHDRHLSYYGTYNALGALLNAHA